MGGSSTDSYWQQITDPLGTLEPDRDYSLTVALGRYKGSQQVNTEIRLRVGSDFNGQLIKALNIPANTVAADTFQDFTLNVSSAEVQPFLALHQGESLVVEFDGNMGGGYIGALDNVRLSFIPEPTTATLLALGGLLVLRRRTA
jgi:hypothetical protein